MRCLITGSRGLVGSNLSSILSSQYGWDIVGLGSSGVDEKKYFKADIADREVMSSVTKKIGPVDIVIHCAALVDMNADPVEIFRTNILGSLNVLALCKAMGGRKFVNLSSVPVVGRIHHTPITEDDICSPLTGYHLSKLQAEQILEMYAGEGMDCVSFRIPSPLGVHMPLRSIFPVLLNNALENKPIRLTGDSRRLQDFLDLRDLAAAVVAVSRNKVRGVYHIASGRGVGNLELANEIIKGTSSSSVIFNEMSTGSERAEEWLVNTDKACRDFGYRSNYTLADTIAWLARGGV